MNAIKMSFIVALIAACFVCLATASNQVEVCQWETFEARCATDEVIMMKQASYGRMRVGKCLPKGTKYIGCSADVTEYMHSRCSGQQNCDVPVPDAVMFAHQPCPIDLVAHLEAEYECVKVTKWDQKSCDNVLTATSGFIAKPSNTIRDIRMRHHCPHRIVAQPGQTISVYLSDFFNKYHYQPTYDVLGTPGPIPDCINYGHITEEGNPAPSGICGGQLQKDVMVYRSKSNVVDITLAGPSSHSHYYLIKFEVFGCPLTLDAPENGWINYQDGKAFIHCNNSHTASELVCKNNQWEGRMQDCSVQESPIHMAISALSAGPFTNSGIVVAVVAGVALGVVIGVLFLIIVSCRSKKPEKKLSMYDTKRSDDYKICFDGLDDIDYFPVIDPNYVPVISADGLKSFISSDSEYYSAHLSTFSHYADSLPNKEPVSDDMAIYA